MSMSEVVEGGGERGLNVTPLYECPIDQVVSAHFSLGQGAKARRRV